MIRTKVVELPEGRVADIQDTTITWVSNGPMGTMIKVHKGTTDADNPAQQ